jgi:hypothetical protein
LAAVQWNIKPAFGHHSSAGKSAVGHDLQLISPRDERMVARNSKPGEGAAMTSIGHVFYPVAAGFEVGGAARHHSRLHSAAPVSINLKAVAGQLLYLCPRPTGNAC